MNFVARVSKVFAVLFLFFVNFFTANAQSDSLYRLPAGTKIMLNMDSGISSKISSVNDTFTTTVSKPLSVRSSVVLPVGTVIEGRVTKVSSAASGGKDGRMLVRFETIRFADNRKRSIDALLVNELKPASSRTRDMFTVFGGTALGAIFGAVSKGEKGALIGAGIGAGTGVGIAVLRKGTDVFLRTNEAFEIELRSEVTLPARDY
ncbi:MAG: hypothetical protein ABIU09_12105 [Pyrinomonadaceae bacterium]